MLKERQVEGSTCTGVGVGIAVQSLQFASVEVSYSNRRNAVGEVADRYGKKAKRGRGGWCGGGCGFPRRRCAGLQVEDVRC